MPQRSRRKCGAGREYAGRGVAVPVAVLFRYGYEWHGYVCAGLNRAGEG